MSLNNLQEINDNIKDVVNFEKSVLIDSVEELEEKRETNEFLREIAENYKLYRSSMIDQKKRQQLQLLYILDYLDSLLETQAITKYSLSHTKNEQNRIINEIKQLQKDMDNIILD